MTAVDKSKAAQAQTPNLWPRPTLRWLQAEVDETSSQLKSFSSMNRSRLSTNFHNASTEKRQELVKEYHTSYQITVKKAGKESKLLIDLRGGDGEITTEVRGHPGAYVQIDDYEFCDWAEGDANGQKLFLSGKMKIKGNIMAVAKLDDLFQELRSLE
ncbi:hypothetical protein APSETT444_008323 [Aspergillus pseudonomiae]